MQDLPNEANATHDPGLEFLARVDDVDPDVDPAFAEVIDLDAFDAETSWLADPFTTAEEDGGEGGFDASLFQVSADELPCSDPAETEARASGPFDVSAEQDDGDWLYATDEGFELDVEEDGETLNQAEVDAMAAACFAPSPDAADTAAEPVTLTASGRVEIASSGEAVEKLQLTPARSDPETVPDEALLAMVGDTLSPEELQSVAALSLDPTTVDSLLAASERIRPPEASAPPPVDLAPVLDEVREPVIEAIRDLRDSLASYQGIEHLLLELSQGSERAASAHGEEVAEMRAELVYVRQEIELTRDATLVFTNTVRELVTAMQSTRFRTRDSNRFAYSTAITGLLLCLGTIGWAVNGYRQTSELSYAVIGLLAVNLIAGAGLLLARRNHG